MRNLLFRAVVAAAKEVVAAAEGAKTPASHPPISAPPTTSSPPPIPKEELLFRPASLPTTPVPTLPPPSPTPTPTSPTPYPFPLTLQEDAGVEGGGEEVVAVGAVEVEVSGRNKVETPSTSTAAVTSPAPPAPPALTSSLSRILLLHMDGPDPEARPMPRRPIMREGEDDDAYDARLEAWSARVAALSPSHATLRELADRPIDHALMVERIRKFVNPKLAGSIKGLDTKAALPILATNSPDADVSLRVFPLFGKMGHLANGLGLDVGPELVSMMAELGWHVYGAEYSAQVFYVLFVPVSATAADIADALKVMEAQQVKHLAAPEWPLLNGVPVISVWNKMPL